MIEKRQEILVKDGLSAGNLKFSKRSDFLVLLIVYNLHTSTSLRCDLYGGEKFEEKFEGFSSVKVAPQTTHLRNRCFSLFLIV